MKMLVNILIGLLVLGALGVGAFFYLGHKSQSGDIPGLVDGVLAPCSSKPNCVVSEAHADDKHRVAPLPSGAWGQIAAVIEASGGKIVVTRDDYIAAQYQSKTFRFVDDIEFRKADDAVHVRSASRVGYSDRGVNRARVEALRAALGN